jgi:hypothetical protein
LPALEVREASDDQGVFKIQGGFLAIMLNAVGYCFAQEVEPQAVLLDVDLLQEVVAKADEVGFPYGALEEGELDALAKIEADPGDATQPPPAFLLQGGHIISYQDKHA